MAPILGGAAMSFDATPDVSGGHCVLKGLGDSLPLHIKAIRSFETPTFSLRQTAISRKLLRVKYAESRKAVLRPDEIPYFKRRNHNTTDWHFAPRPHIYLQPLAEKWMTE